MTRKLKESKSKLKRPNIILNKYKVATTFLYISKYIDTLNYRKAFACKDLLFNYTAQPNKTLNVQIYTFVDSNDRNKYIF